MIDLARGADANAFASMLVELLRQNLADKPSKLTSFRRLKGAVAIVVDDADVAVTIHFDGKRAEVFDGIVGVPSLTVRGDSEQVLALSNLPLTTRWALPIPHPRDKEGQQVSRAFREAIRAKKLRMFGALLHPLFALRLTRVMSVHG